MNEDPTNEPDSKSCCWFPRLRPGQLRPAGVLLALVVSILVGSPAMADDEPGDAPQITNVVVGFEGNYKLGYWTPVQVTVSGGAQGVTGALRLQTRDGDGELSQYVSDFILTAVAGEETTGQLYVKFGQREPELQVELVSADAVLATKTLRAGPTVGEDAFFRPLAATDELVLTLGPSIGVAEALRGGAARNDERQTRAVSIDSIAELPLRWYGYEGVDAVVIATSQAGIATQLTPDLPQSQALVEWIELGGRLVMSVGIQAREALADGTLLEALAPGTLAGMTPLRRTAPLEGYLETVEHMDVDVRFRTEVPRLVDVQGRIEVHEGNRPTDLPLVIRAPRVFGEVVFIAVDLDREPYASWLGRSEVINKLLRREVAKAVAVDDQALGAVTTVGYNDLAGQLRSALDQFPGVPMVPFFVVALLVFGYLLLIGPLDFLLVKKVFRRMELTWVTFAVWVVLVSGLGYFAAQWLKGDSLRLNQVQLVDVDLASGQVRGTLWANIFSPRADTYNLSLTSRVPRATDAEPQTLLSWMGLPGTGLGAMNAGGDSPRLFREPYTFAPSLAAIEQMPIQIWSSKSITARWRQSAQLAFEHQLQADADSMLVGTLENDLPFDLRNARLFYDRWVYPIASLPAGQSIRVGEQLQPLLSQTLLTRERAVNDRIAVSSYDQQTLDIDRILEMMMFHGAAGGSNYTGLWNRYQHFSDFSGHLRTGRAVLVAPLEQPLAELLRDGDPLATDDQQQQCYLRLIIPVQRD